MDREVLAASSGAHVWVECPVCAESRSKINTRSLKVHLPQNIDGTYKVKCFHPGCSLYNDTYYKIDIAPTAVPVQDKEFIVPVPDDVPDPQLQGSWLYRDINGNRLFYFTRIPMTKRYSYWGYTKDGWTPGKPYFEKALYGAELLGQSENDNKSVIVVEGEKAADRGRKYFPNYIVVTWSGGANNWKSGDWELLAGRHVILWPDADSPGFMAMGGISEELKKYQCDVQVVNTKGLSDGFDVADLSQDEAIARLPSAMNSYLTWQEFKKQLDHYADSFKFGYSELDEQLSIPSHSLIIVEGRTKHGKSIAALNLLYNLLKQHKKVHFYSLELPKKEIMKRLARIVDTEIPEGAPAEVHEHYKNLFMNEDSRISILKDTLGKYLFIDDAHTDIDYIIKECKRINDSDTVVFIDYIQKLTGSFQGDRSQEKYKSYIDKLQRIGITKGIPVVIMSQVTPAMQGSHPIEDRVRESADISYAADIELRLWNKNVAIEADNAFYSMYKKGNYLLQVVINRHGEAHKVFQFNIVNGCKLIEAR